MAHHSPTHPAGPPVAARRPTTREHHGRTRTDDYDWLRDKDSPEVLAHLEAENAWAEARTAHLADLRATLFEEIRSRTRESDLSVPTRVRGHWYYGRTFAGREHGATCRVPVSDPDDWTPPRPAEDLGPDEPALPGEQVLLDLDALAEGHDYFSAGGSAISPDDRVLAWSTDVVGDERYTVRMRELATGEPLPDELVGVAGGVTWDRAGESVLYSTYDESWRADKVWRHRLGTAQADDELVHHERDARFSTGVGRTRTDRFLVVVAASKTTTELRFLDADDPGAGWQLLHPRTEGLEVGLDHAVVAGEDRFVLTHNHTGPDFEVALAPIGPSGPDTWEPLVPHDPAVRIEDVDAFATHLVVHQRSEGLTQLRIIELGPDGPGADHLVDVEHEVHTVGAGANPEFDQPVVRLGRTTMVVPASVHDHDVRTGELTLLKQTPVLGGYDPGQYEEHRLWAEAEDGERVPVTVVARRDAPRPMPVLLYGYGAYEQSLDPWFSASRLSLLDRGAAFAVAHVRGGGELGRRWYDGGRLEHKQHTFSDFVACARHLVATGWTTPAQTVAEGGSAGGLLIGAVLNQSPGDFGAAVAQVPFVDTLTSMLDPDLPLTVTEYDEWGDPGSDPRAYDRIAGYAPYDNVVDQDYPPILVETSLHDTRVLFTEPVKWVARLRATAPGTDVLLRTEMAAGHGGVSGRYQAWHDRARTLAWILDRMGLAEATPSG